MRVLRVFILFAALFVVGIVFLVGGIQDKVNLGKVHDISQVEPSQLKSGMIVEGTIVEIWDEYAYEEDDSITYSYYAMPLESSFGMSEPVFVALCLGNSSDKALAAKMSKETDDFYLNDIIPTVWTELPFTGKVTKLKGEARDYFEEYIEEMEFDPDTNMEPYVIKRFKAGSENIKLIAGGIMTVIGLAVSALLVFFRIAKSRR